MKRFCHSAKHRTLPGDTHSYDRSCAALADRTVASREETKLKKYDDDNKKTPGSSRRLSQPRFNSPSLAQFCGDALRFVFGDPLGAFAA